MGDALKLMVIAGARPNFMKIAPLLRKLDEHNAIVQQLGKGQLFNVCLVHTGQHYDEKMSQVFFSELGIRSPDVNLSVGSGSHAVQSANIMLKFEPVCQAKRPDWVIVVGDVNSTMACTLVASKLGIKVAHIEAGLRSFDRTMPEELNRLVTDCLADLLLTPSSDANENLKREGIPEGKIRLVGNIMIDALLENLPTARASRIMEKLGLKPGKFGYVTLHRPANVDEEGSLRRIMEELEHFSQRMPIVFPVHPRTSKMLRDFRITLRSDSAMRLVDPLGYHDSLCLCESARFVLTDSGGLQEEATFFRTPCLTLRPNTERPVTVALGSNRLTSVERLRDDYEKLMARNTRLGEVPPLWDGKTATRIIEALNA